MKKNIGFGLTVIGFTVLVLLVLGSVNKHRRQIQAAKFKDQYCKEANYPADLGLDLFHILQEKVSGKEKMNKLVQTVSNLFEKAPGIQIIFDQQGKWVMADSWKEGLLPVGSSSFHPDLSLEQVFSGKISCQLIETEKTFLLAKGVIGKPISFVLLLERYKVY